MRRIHLNWLGKSDKSTSQRKVSTSVGVLGLGAYWCSIDGKSISSLRHIKNNMDSVVESTAGCGEKRLRPRGEDSILSKAEDRCISIGIAKPTSLFVPGGHRTYHNLKKTSQSACLSFTCQYRSHPFELVQNIHGTVHDILPATLYGRYARYALSEGHREALRRLQRHSLTCLSDPSG